VNIKSELKYIELKPGYSDNGPAWIGKVEFSKSGKTVYFNGHAFKSNDHGGCSDIERRQSAVFGLQTSISLWQLSNNLWQS
jgi:hypothetical protein